MADNVSTNGEADPAAEFLAREQETLAGLEDDLNLSARTNGLPVDVFGETNGHSDDEGARGSDVYSNTSSQNADPKPEPEKIRVWREEQEQMLKQKDDEEAVKREELKQQAKRELAEWKTRYAEQLEKSKKNNRNAEKEWIAERDQEDPGLEWDKIAKMCDFNPKSARNTKDTSRLRSILLQLKQSPPSPPQNNASS